MKAQCEERISHEIALLQSRDNAIRSWFKVCTGTELSPEEMNFIHSELKCGQINIKYIGAEVLKLRKKQNGFAGVCST